MCDTPVVGDVWLSKRVGEQDRTVTIIETDSDPDGVVRVESRTNVYGRHVKPVRRVLTKDTLGRWHRKARFDV